MKECSRPELLDELLSLKHHKNLITCQEHFKYTVVVTYTGRNPPLQRLFKCKKENLAKQGNQYLASVERNL